MEIFDSTFGFVRGLSRIEEQNKRFMKKMKNLKEKQVKCKLDHEHTAECIEKAEAEAQNKKLLNKIFDVSSFMGDSDLIERFSDYINKILINSSDSFI